MRQLARTMGLRESTTTGHVDRMVAMGFVKRQRDPRDRRSRSRRDHGQGQERL